MFQGTATSGRQRPLWFGFDPASMASSANTGVSETTTANVVGRWTRTTSAGASFQAQAYFDHAHRNEAIANYNRRTWDVDAQYHTTFATTHEFVGGGRQGTAAARSAADLQLLQTHSQRPELLGARRGVRHRAHGRKVHARHLLHLSRGRESGVRQAGRGQRDASRPNLGACPSNGTGRVPSAVPADARRRDAGKVGPCPGAATPQMPARRRNPQGTWGLRASPMRATHAITRTGS